MSTLAPAEQQKLLDEQVQRWKKEMGQLADRIAFATKHSCAVVLITGTDEAYADVHPQLVLEDALGFNPRGWPDGFTFDVLNARE